MDTYNDQRTARQDQERYDKDLVKSGVIEVCFHYLGHGKRQGTRYVWRCPECGKAEKFSATAKKLLGGCLNAGCSMPQTMDAIEIIGFFENIPATGSGFVRILERGYEILNLPSPGSRPRSAGNKTATGPTTQPNPRNEGGPQNTQQETQRKATPGWTMAPAAERTGRTGPDNTGEGGTGAGEPRSEEPEITVDDGITANLPEVMDDVITVDPEDVEEVDDGAGVGADPKTNLRYERLDAHRRHEMGPMREALRGEADAWAIYEEPDFKLDPVLADAVYEVIIEMCSLSESHGEYLKDRGITRMTALRGRIGSMSYKLAREVKKELLTKFSERDLLRVPGFSKKPLRGISFTLSGDYILIPYHDADHNITTIEGRVVGSPKPGMGKYVSLRGSGNHLYVFPDFMPDRLEAFCEGAMGAIVAAQAGIAIGAIQGVRRHRDSNSEGPLAELVGTDFGRRRIPYIPDIDVKPAAKADVATETPKACRNLITNQNGIPQVALLPEGKDLDEWLLTKTTGERRPAFTSFVSGAVPLEHYMELSVKDARKTDQPPIPQDLPDRPGSPGKEAAPETVSERATENPKPVSSQRNSDRSTHVPPAKPGPLYEPPEEEVGPVPPVSPKRHSEQGVGPSKVYAAIARMSSLKQRDIDLMLRFGIPEEITRQAGIGSMSAPRAQHIMADLIDKMGAENLIELSGFSQSGGGRLNLDFTGDYCIIPYRNVSGAVTALHAIPVAEDDQGPCVDGSRKNILCATPGDHLYVPTGQPEQIEVITTSVLEALRLLASGLQAAAIRKPGSYKPAPGATSMAELEDVDFAGRTVLYSPLLGNPPSENVRKDSPNAMRALIARHKGTPAMLKVRIEESEGKTLGQWLVSLPVWKRRAEFDLRLQNAEKATNLLREQNRQQEKQEKQEKQERRETTPGTTKATTGTNSQQTGGDSVTGNPRPNSHGPDEDSPPNVSKPPLIFPRPGYVAPTPPRNKLLTPDEVLSGISLVLIGMITILGVLTLLRLPGELSFAMRSLIGEPVAGRGIDPVPFALAWLDTAFAAISAAVYQSLAGAIVWGCVAGCFLMPFAIWRRRLRRKRVLRMLRVESGRSWRIWPFKRTP